MTETPTDEQVLADPGSFTVEQVTSVFERTADDAVVAAKQLEADGEGRKGIVGWERPAARHQGEPEFSRERLLSADGPLITGHPRYVIVGALHGVERETFTREQIAKTINEFLEREVETPEPIEQEA